MFAAQHLHAIACVYSPIYTKAAGVALIAQMRQEKELRTNEDDWPWLRVPPTPSEPLGQILGEKLVSLAFCGCISSS